MLNKVGVYAKQLYREKLSYKVFTLVDEVMEQLTDFPKH